MGLGKIKCKPHSEIRTKQTTTSNSLQFFFNFFFHSSVSQTLDEEKNGQNMQKQKDEGMHIQMNSIWIPIRIRKHGSPYTIHIT